MSKKKKFFLIIYLFVSVLLFVTISYGTAEIRNYWSEERVCISDDWTYESFRSGKDISVRDFLARYPMEGEKEYVMKGSLPEELTGAESLYFYSQNLELSVAVDGKTIYKLSSVGGHKITGTVENIVPLPDNSAGKEIIITYHSDGFYRYKAIESVYLGRESTFIKGVFLKQLPLLLFSFLCFIIGIVQMLSGSGGRGDSKQMQFLGWVTLMYSLWAFGTSRLIDFFSNYQINFQNSRHFALAMVAYPMLEYGNMRYSVKQGILDKCLKGLSFLNVIIIMFGLHFLNISLEESAVVTYLILGLVYIRILYEQIRELAGNHKGGARRRQGYAIISLIGILVTVVGFAADIVRYIGSFGEGWLYFLPIGYLIMSCILSYQGLKGALEMMRLGKRSESVKQMAYFDMLTQVYNRTALNEDMEKYEGAKKEKKNFGIVVFDVNNLKWVNDNLGHLAGDKLLQDSAAIIRDSFEDYGKTYRFGGDEFVVVMEEGAKEKYSLGIQQMDQCLLRHNEKCKKEEKISIAYGVAYYDGSDNRTLWQVQESADTQMYERKRRMKAKMFDGKNVRKD